MTPVQLQVIAQISRALRRLGADLELLATVGSIGDTLDDAEVLALLETHNDRAYADQAHNN